MLRRYFLVFGAPFSLPEVHRIDIPATRLARGNHVGGLFFSGSAAVAAGQSIRRPPGPARGDLRGN